MFFSKQLQNAGLNFVRDRQAKIRTNNEYFGICM